VRYYHEELGGAKYIAKLPEMLISMQKSEQECFEQIKKMISYIRGAILKKLHKVEPKEPLEKYKAENIVPSNPRYPMTLKDVIKSITDGSVFFEIMGTLCSKYCNLVWPQ
jgi:acetyl-CoA carboxylase carboxyltransferase component